MNRFILSLLCILLASCVEKDYSDPQKYIKDGDVLLFCTSEYNIPSEILFYQSNQIKNIEESIQGKPFISYYITDIHGKVFTINMNEINNFSCYEIN